MSIAQRYANERESQRRKLAEHQMVQAMVADIQLYAARMVTLDVARHARLDAGESIRHHSSMAKVLVSKR